MLRTVFRATPSFFFPLFEHRNENDYNMLEKSPSELKETGWDRVKKMYSTDEFSEVSVELHNVIQQSLCGAVVGACFGGFVKSREAYLYFIENNQATTFKTTIQAKKQLQDYVTVAFAKGAYRWGWKVWCFTGIFSLIVTTVSVYYDDTSILEYVFAGTITGALFKAHLGLAATLVGAGLGAVLSTVGGLAILGILKVTGAQMADVKRALYKIKEARQAQFNEVIEKSSTIKNDELTRHHDMIVEKKGVEQIVDL